MKINFGTNIGLNTRNCKDQTNFKGHFGNLALEKIMENGINAERVVFETGFFREASSLEFTLNACKKLFAGKAIKGLIGGCSTGEEAFTVAMMAEKIDLPIELKGFDISSLSVRRAKEGVFPMRMPEERLLFHPKYRHCDAIRDFHLAFNSKNLNEKQQSQVELFNKYFNDATNEETIGYYKENTKIPFEEQNFLPDILKMVKIKPEKQNICTFEQGDVLELSTIAKKDSMDFVTFRNAMHNLTFMLEPFGCRYLKDENTVTRIYSKVVDNVRDILKKNGLFVIDTYVADPTTRAIEKNVLTERGFKDVFGEFDGPTVWQKVV